MINIKDHQVNLEGTSDELSENLLDFCLYLATHLQSKDKEFERVFSIDGILRALFTTCSTQEEIYKNLLKSIQGILNDVTTGKFRLIYKDLGHNVEISGITIDMSEHRSDEDD